MPPAARIGDNHVCPMATPGTPPVPHVGGPVNMGSPTVKIGYMPAARVGDMCICVGPPDTIAKGSLTVKINFMPAARIGDLTVHGGSIVVGFPTVMIGDVGMGQPSSSSGGVGAPAPSLWERITGWVEDLLGLGQDPDDQKLQDIKDLLNRSATGADAVEYIEDNDIPVEFADGGGSYWDGSKIVIDRSESTEDAALTLVHEVHHARSDREGTSADIDKDSRDDYVNGMVDEESEGTVKSIQTKRELEENGENLSATFPLEEQYNQAYDQAAEDHRNANPDATDEEVAAAAEAAGLQRVKDGFNDGEVVTSTSGDPYPDYYGDAWDDHHAP